MSNKELIPFQVGDEVLMHGKPAKVIRANSHYVLVKVIGEKVTKPEERLFYPDGTDVNKEQALKTKEQ